MDAERPLLPDFLIGGAPRSGTTFLCHALDRHPGIYLAKPYIPEPKVFIGPAQSAEKYRQRYAAMFAPAQGQRVLGEKSTYYLENEEACARIRAHLPGVKVLFLVREPVARAYSNYLWSRKNGLETLSFEEAIERGPNRPSPLPPDKSYARPFDYLERGDYGRFAERWFAALGRERVAFFLYEDIDRQPEQLLEEIQRFLGVEPLPFSVLDPGVVNSAGDQGPPLSLSTEIRLRERMAPLVRHFAAVTGLDVTVWRYDSHVGARRHVAAAA